MSLANKICRVTRSPSAIAVQMKQVRLQDQCWYQPTWEGLKSKSERPKRTKGKSVSNERHQRTSFPRSLIAECGDGMCTGTHDVTEMISLRTAPLDWWNESMHSSIRCVVEVRARC